MSNMSVNSYNIYRSTTSGVAVHDIVTCSQTEFIPYTGGINSVWASDSYLYAATSDNGIVYCNVSSPYIFSSFKSYPDISSDNVRYLNGKGDYLCAVTTSGVDSINVLSDSINSRFITTATKCVQMSNGEFYYVTNDFVPADNLKAPLFDWRYVFKIELSGPITKNDYIYACILPTSIYDITVLDGKDILVFNDSGVSLPYCFELWGSDTPTLCVKTTIGTSNMYVVVGNENIDSSFSRSTVSDLYDDFDGTTLNTSKWTFSNGGYTNNTYSVSGGKFRMIGAHPSYPITLTSTTTFSGAVIEYSFSKYINNLSYPNNMDFSAYFVGGTGAYIGGSTSNEPHRLVTGTSLGTVYGTVYVGTGYNTHIVEGNSNFQSSLYRGEYITASGIASLSNRAVRFRLVSNTTGPYVDIDWIRVRKRDSYEPSYVVNSYSPVTSAYNYGELHAVYNSGEHTYTPGAGSIIKASYINDLYVSEGTAPNGYNTIIIGTDYGAYSIREDRGNEDNSDYDLYLMNS